MSLSNKLTDGSNAFTTSKPLGADFTRLIVLYKYQSRRASKTYRDVRIWTKNMGLTSETSEHIRVHAVCFGQC